MLIQTDRALISSTTPVVRHLAITVTAPAQWIGHVETAAGQPSGFDRASLAASAKLAVCRDALTHTLAFLAARDAVRPAAGLPHLQARVPAPAIRALASVPAAAPDVVLELTCGDGVELTMINGVRAETRRPRIRVPLGSLRPHQQVTMALAAACAPQPAGTTVCMQFGVTDREGRMHTPLEQVQWRAAPPDEHDRQPVDDAALVVVAQALAGQARRAVHAALTYGDDVEAQRVIGNTITHLLGLSPGNRQIIELAESLQLYGFELERAILRCG